eukprot:gnl/TRDRNA2_/TRDRNA2_204069_c0_seq1.p1 gnl/TRDRNA2_/TRDRNA2_204069_c0~~gnl/TRDRNA2_/TRDRNA2_204069_c0_seq1.p1  ORF type:complete len:425 (-),score=31.38 gnl/TRDRNA2_/TRDRNA2_204069_c0_seq1:89-1363(-)
MHTASSSPDAACGIQVLLSRVLKVTSRTARSGWTPSILVFLLCGCTFALLASEWVQRFILQEPAMTIFLMRRSLWPSSMKRPEQRKVLIAAAKTHCICSLVPHYRMHNLSVEAFAKSVNCAMPWSSAPKWLWRTVWRGGQRAVPQLHRWDAAAPENTCVNLMVCWLKALSGNRRWTSSWDDGLAYDMLPPVTRWLVSWPLCLAFPPLHHQNVALRTAYLDQSIACELSLHPQGDTSVLVLGAGFDVRSLRFLLRYPGNTTKSARRLVDPESRLRWTELDLPDVVQQKRALYDRLLRRRPQLAGSEPHLVGVNLTDTSAARDAVRSSLRLGPRPGTVLYVLEALLIYIPEAPARELLAVCVEEAQAAGADRCILCFVDRLPAVEGLSAESAASMLAQAGLTLDMSSWLPKPGLANHMGVARSSFQ